MSTPNDPNMNDIMESIRRLMEANQNGIPTDLPTGIPHTKEQKIPSSSSDSTEEILDLTRKISTSKAPSPSASIETAPPHTKTQALTNMSPHMLDGLLADHLKPLIQKHIQSQLPLLIEQTVQEEMAKFLKAYTSRPRPR